MTTLLPDRVVGRRTLLRVDASSGGRPRVRSETMGDRGLTGVRAMLLDSGPGRARVCLIPDGALLLAGDVVEVEIVVGAGVALELVEPAGTVAYDMRGGSARWDVAITLEAGAALAWAGEPFVVAAGARVTRNLSVVVGDGARLAIRELLVLGRSGERSGELDQWCEVRDDGGRRLLVEELRLSPAAHRPGVLGGYRVLGSVLGIGLDLPAELGAPDRFDLDDGSVLWRRLTAQAHHAVGGDLWQAVRDAC